MATAADKYFVENRGPDLRATLTPFERSSRERTWTASKIWEIHHEVIRLLLIGMRGVDIASKLNLTEAQVSSIRNSPVIQDKLSLMQAARDVKSVDIAKDILETAPEALKLLKKILNGEVIVNDTKPSVMLMAKTAESLMDRAGFGAVKKVATSNEHVHYSAEEIEAIKSRARFNGEVVQNAEFSVAA